MHPTFMNNPQYLLRFPAQSAKSDVHKSDMRLAVKGSKDLPLNVKVAYHTGKRITEYVLHEHSLDATIDALVCFVV